MTLGERLNGRDNALNFVRLILASSVLVSHSFLLTGTPTGIRLLYPKSGDLAVDGFFALSGFLIAGARMRSSLKGFFWRRIIRIMPAFWLCLILIAFVFAPAEAAATGEAWSVGSAARFVWSNALLVVQQPGIDYTLLSVPSASIPNVGSMWSGPLWTLAWEFACYIGCGLLLSFRTVRTNQLPVLAALLVSFTALGFIGPQTLRWLSLSRLGAFFTAGMILNAVKHRVPLNAWLMGLATAAFVSL